MFVVGLFKVPSAEFQSVVTEDPKRKGEITENFGDHKPEIGKTAW